MFSLLSNGARKQNLVFSVCHVTFKYIKVKHNFPLSVMTEVNSLYFWLHCKFSFYSDFIGVFNFLDVVHIFYGSFYFHDKCRLVFFIGFSQKLLSYFSSICSFYFLCIVLKIDFFTLSFSFFCLL